jgi:hypothetical protein
MLERITKRIPDIILMPRIFKINKLLKSWDVNLLTIITSQVSLALFSTPKTNTGKNSSKVTFYSNHLKVDL